MRRPALAIGLVFVLATPRSSRADPTNSKSESTAVALTIGGSIVPLGLLATGFVDRDLGQEIWVRLGALTAIPGPGIGHWYARGSAKVGVVARVGASAITLYGSVVVGDQALCRELLRAGETAGLDACEGPSRGVGLGLIAAGLTVYAGSVVYDLVTVRREVRASAAQVSPIVSSTNGITLVGIAARF